jgi:hypothetical protein
MFLEKRVYQGSSGVVYPYPVIESISPSKKDVPYRAVFLENEYLKIMLLPQYGGQGTHGLGQDCPASFCVL